MHIEQAIFTSVATTQMRGYQLAARSSGVSDFCVQQLSHWGPTQGAMISSDLKAESLNFFRLHGDRLAITRTVHGGPEYSSRGQLQTFTRILLFQREQLRGYDNDPLAVLLTARSLGLLRFSSGFDRQLPAVELPDAKPLGLPRNDAHADSPRMKRASELLLADERVAIEGEEDPEGALGYLFEATPEAERLALSFTTGLTPSTLRPFRLHFLPAHSSTPCPGLQKVR